MELKKETEHVRRRGDVPARQTDQGGQRFKKPRVVVAVENKTEVQGKERIKKDNRGMERKG